MHRRRSAWSTWLAPGSSTSASPGWPDGAARASRSRTYPHRAGPARLSAAGGTSIDRAAVHAALERARDVLWRTQGDDGSWDSPGDMGPMPTAQVLVALHHVGRLSSDDAAQGARWLRARQATDGSFRSYPTAPEGDLGATASAWAAMHVCAPGESAEAIARARGYIDAQGGTGAVVNAFGRGDPAVVYLALAGLVEPSALPCPPMLPALIPPLVRFMERRFHSGILMVSGALTLIAHRLRGTGARRALRPARSRAGSPRGRWRCSPRSTTATGAGTPTRFRRRCSCPRCPPRASASNIRWSPARWRG